MTIDFTTIIPCLGPASIDAAAVRHALHSMDPNGSLEIIVGDTAAADGTAPKGAMVSYEGLSFGILEFDVPLPVSTLDYGPSPNFLWPNAGADLKKHTSHVRVVLTDQPSGRAQMVIASQALMLITAAVCKVAKPLGILWCPADYLVKPSQFMAATRKLLETRQPPADIWIRLVTAKVNGGIVLATHGLANYVGREVEFAPNKAFDSGTLGIRAMQIGEYLIERGVELKSGDTIGPEKFKIALADDGVATSGAIYQMTAP